MRKRIIALVLAAAMFCCTIPLQAEEQSSQESERESLRQQAALDELSGRESIKPRNPMIERDQKEDRVRESWRQATEQFIDKQINDTDSTSWDEVKEETVHKKIEKIAKEEGKKIFGEKAEEGIEILHGLYDFVDNMEQAMTYESPSSHATFRVASGAIGYYVAVSEGFISIVDATGLGVATIPLEIINKILEYGRDFIDTPEVVDALNSMNPWFLQLLDWIFEQWEKNTDPSRGPWGMPRKNFTETDTWRIRMTQNANCYKPNIYLYGNAGTELTLTFEQPQLLTETIPTYEGSWQVVLEEDGKLTVDGLVNQEYLFYESLTLTALMQDEKGFLLQADERKELFGTLLQKYGFNEKEIADFIEFWDQKLESNVDYVMYPQLTETVDVAMPITVESEETIDSYYRIWFYFVEVDDVKMAEVAQPEIVPVEHDGFTLVEWGGIIE